MEKTFYEFWKNQTGCGSFQFALLNAYSFADSVNRQILETVFPDLFVEKRANW